MEIIRSLRKNLLSGEMHYSLSRRILMAKELVKSVSYVHNLNFVHKHIYPETIILLWDLGLRFSTFLIGFDNFRAADGGTNFVGDAK
jgi:serine/threonine protein kinase